MDVDAIDGLDFFVAHAASYGTTKCRAGPGREENQLEIVT